MHAAASDRLGRPLASVHQRPARQRCRTSRSSAVCSIDIHGQHAHQSLLETGSQRAAARRARGARRRRQAGGGRLRGLARQLEQDSQHRRDASARTRRAARAPALPDSPSSKRLHRPRASPSSLRVERDRLANTDRLLELASAPRSMACSTTRPQPRTQRSFALAPSSSSSSTHDPELREPSEQLARSRDRAARARIGFEPLSRAHRSGSGASRAGSTNGSQSFARSRAATSVAESSLAETLAALRARVDDLDGGGRVARGAGHEGRESARELFR